MSLQQERTNVTRTCYHSEELRALFSHSLRLMRIQARSIPQVIRIQEARSSVSSGPLVLSTIKMKPIFRILLCALCSMCCVPSRCSIRSTFWDAGLRESKRRFTQPQTLYLSVFHIHLSNVFYCLMLTCTCTDWYADARGERLGVKTRSTLTSWLDFFEYSWLLTATSQVILIQIAI